MATKAPTKTELERQKLEAELRKTSAEAVYWEAKGEQISRMLGYEDACDESNYVYQFNQAVSAKSVQVCIDTLNRWSRTDPKAPFTIYFDSPGGSVIDGLSLYDTIQSFRRKGHHVTTVTRGYAASMAGILLQAGDLRLVGPRAWMLIHEVSSMAWGKSSEMEDELKFVRRLQAQLLDILAARSTMTAKQIATKWKKTDWWLDAEESVALGFADYVEGTEPTPKPKRRGKAEVAFTPE